MRRHREGRPVRARVRPRLGALGSVLALLLPVGCAARPSPASARYEQRLEQGRTLARQGRLSEAAEALEDATLIETERPEAHYLLAKALVALGEDARALDELGKARSLRPGHGPQEVLFGETLTRMGRLPEAREVLGAAAERWSDSARCRHAIGVLDLREDRVGEAEAHLQKAVRLDPSLRGAREALGRALLRLGSTEEAIRQLEQAAGADECDDLAHGGLASALLVAGRIEQARSSFGDAIRCAQARHAAPWRAGLALVDAAAGDPGRALSELAEAADFFPAHVGRVLQRRLEEPPPASGREAGRRRDRQPVSACQPAEADCDRARERLWTAALLQFVLGAPDAAVREITDSIAAYEGDAMAHWIHAEALFELGRGPDALLALDRATAWEPSEEVSAAMEALRSRIGEDAAP